MTTAEELKKKIKVVMFDQYGTVVDMQKGLTEAFTPFLTEKGWHGNPGSLVTWYRRTHFENSMIDGLLHKDIRHTERSAFALWLTPSTVPPSNTQTPKSAT